MKTNTGENQKLNKVQEKVENVKASAKHSLGLPHNASAACHNRDNVTRLQKRTTKQITKISKDNNFYENSYYQSHKIIVKR